MNAEIRRKLSMVARVLVFEKENPSTEPGHTALVTRLQEIADQGHQRAQQESAGGVAELASRAQRRTLRREIDRRLRQVARVGRRAARTDPTLAATLEPPRSNLPNRTFIGMAEAMLAVANGIAPALTAAGLGATDLAELGDRIAAFNAAGTAADGSRLDHITANADLDTLGREIGEIVHILDGDNRTRFAGDATRLTEWNSARNIFGSGRAATTQQPVTPPEPPPAGTEAPPASTDAAA